MWSRFQYILRETWASSRRNLTLTIAAIITAAVSLLIFGLTLLMQKGFDNLLTRWEGGVEMIVFMNPGTTQDNLDIVAGTLDQQVGRGVESYWYCDVDCSFTDFQNLFAGDPTTLKLLTKEKVPTQFRVVPVEGTTITTLTGLKAQYAGLPNVNEVLVAEEQVDLIGRLQGFVNTYTTGLWIALMGASGLLIWNTIRTAMFARRREIEVMKLVGATDWFIRIPFMLEGLIQGFLGGLLAVFSMYFINSQWTKSVADFPDNTGMTALVVTSGYELRISLLLLGFGSLVGMVGAGLAASRFLDV